MSSCKRIIKACATAICALLAEWEAYLQQYLAAHPEVKVIDRLDRIKALHNRATMLRPLQGDGITLLRVRNISQHVACLVLVAARSITLLQGHVGIIARTFRVTLVWAVHGGSGGGTSRRDPLPAKW